MKIRHLKYAEIDKSKWDATVANSIQERVYGMSWYLDAATNHSWEALVANDYEWVMPLPVKKWYLGIQTIYQPVLCQQLGVFGKPTSPELIADFFKAIPGYYAEVVFSLNSENVVAPIDGFQCQTKTNLELELNTPYELIYKGFQKGVKSAIRKGAQQLTLSETVDITGLITFYREVMQERLGLKPAVYERIEAVLTTLQQHKAGLLVEARDSAGTLVGANFFAVSHGRIINLFGTSNEQGRKLEAMHNMVHFAIERFASNPFVLDFEGSEIPAIKAFFESFGAKNRPFVACSRLQVSTALKAIRIARKIL